MTRELAPKYDPNECEENWYAHWESSGYFRASPNPDRKPYCVTIPPPNVTGELHMGHAIQHAIHDNVIRRKRMQGYETLCLPGADHAGIATQMKVEEQLAEEEGKTRYDVGREGLLKRIWAWREKYGDAIYNQLRTLGCSYDWERSRFTLDKGYVEAVLIAFERFHSHGWIYRGTRMINWCPNCGTVISDLETEEVDTQGNLWHIRYPGVDAGPDVVVATTRPETMLGDTAVAVHPSDERWKGAVDKQVMLPLMDRPIPIVADDYADPEIGSGAVKITPAHDPNDYEVGDRHDLDQILVIGFEGDMTEKAGRFAGLDRYECRRQVVADLEEAGLLVEVEEHEHAIPHHDKCGTVIEPLPMEQWFMNMKGLAEKTAPFLRNHDVSYVPDRFRGYALDWLGEIRDWALSRQIWWGHRIPAYYCPVCSVDGLIPLGSYDYEKALEQGAFRVSVEAGARPIVDASPPERCPDCGGGNLVQDPDVLDTWFSSALWPFATLGWPQQTEDLEYFHPTDLMITARDILYLWVLRMMMTALEFVEEIPFRTVFVHPTVQTRDGKRMSKSLGTGVNPLDLVRLYGADATRYGLLHQCGTSQDLRFDAEIADNQVKASVSADTARNFCNKLWNAARFVLMNLDDFEPNGAHSPPLTSGDLADRWIRSRLAHTIRRVDDSQDAFRFDEVTRALHDFLWRDYCDWYLELIKPRLRDGTGGEDTHVAQAIAVEVLEQALRLMHPIMPYVTEELWQQLPLGIGRADSIMIADWPQARDEYMDNEAESEMEFMQELITAVRTVRSELNVPPRQPVRILISVAEEHTARWVQARRSYVEALVTTESVEIGVSLPQPPASASAVVRNSEIYIPIEGIIDVEAESQRLRREIDKLRGLVSGLEKKLGNERFLERAPADVVKKEHERQEEYRASLGKLEASLEMLTS
ncbi:MAG: valine--tRNA ligase [Candidatus Latescibacterota bacterium]|nr:valine--tRNA ligase [Candidatus Latescibacterota bacterium]